MVARLVRTLGIVLAVCGLALLAPSRAAAQDPCIVCDPGDDPPIFAVSVEPVGGSFGTVPTNSSGHTHSFQITNSGNYQAESYMLGCSGTNGITCTVSPGSVGLSPGFSTTVTVTFSTGATTGAGSITVTATSQQSSGSGSATGTIVRYGVAVTPDGGNAPQRQANTGGHSETFTVTNTGSASNTFSFACSGAGGVTCGAVPAPVTIGAGLQASVNMPYSVGAVGTGTLTLTATGTNASNPGGYSVPIVSYGVAVTPDGQAVSPPAETASSQVFSVQNTGSVASTYNLGVTCTGAATGCTGPSAVTVQPNTSGSATVTYQAGSAGATGRVKVVAVQSGVPAVTDSGWVDVTPFGQSPLVTIADASPGAVLDRDLCLTIAAGSAAYECGDLRIVHALPGVRTINKARVPTLLYNSQHAQPVVIVAVTVTIPPGMGAPDSVTGVVRMGGVQKVRSKWSGTGWSAGVARRVVLAFEDQALATGIHTDTLEVTSWYGTTPKNAPPVAGSFAVVNRRTSPFGGGWWLAGLERLSPASMTWVGGDGSVRRYQLVTTNVWAAPPVDRPDTLKWDGVNYVRVLPHGVRVKFDAQGRHVATVNRLGHTTTFAYVGSSDTLQRITLPPAAAGKTYDFAYVGGVLRTVTAPPVGAQSRIVTVYAAAGRVDSLRDADQRVVRFGYVGASPRVVSRTDRRGTVVTFGYDAAGKVTQASVALATGAIASTFRALESYGLTTAVDTAIAYARFDGPRTDVADTTVFWLDRFGAPRRVVNALGHATSIKRQHPAFPALATELQAPNGFVTQATYDARGNVVTTTAVNPLGTGANAVTRYHWDATWDFVDSVVTSTGRITTFAYDAASGNRLWQQAGPDAGRRVVFRYGNTWGLLSSTVLPQTPPDSVEYDALGNLAVTRTPKGFDTRYTNDAIGRVTLLQGRLDTLLAIYQSTVTDYDVLSRDTLQKMIGPAVGAAAAETVFVRKFLNPNGQMDSLWRWSRPDITGIGTIRTGWTYDAAGRTLTEVAPDGRQERFTYDPAGNVVADSTRRGHISTMMYDGLNRLVTRNLPAVSYNSRNSNITPYPPQEPYTAYQIPAETHTFTYHVLGGMLTADNPDARVKRSYLPSGLIETDSSWIQTVGRDDWTRHAYGLRHTYDLDGRRTSLTIPAQLGASGLSASMTFGYESQIGLLQTIWDLQGNGYTLSYNLKNELTGLVFPAQYQETFRYDADGQLAADTMRNLGSTAFPRLMTSMVRATTYRYDAQGRLLRSGDPNGFQDTLTLSYSGLGHLVRSKLTQHGQHLYGAAFFARFAAAETFTFDALGNRPYGETRDTTSYDANNHSNSFSTHVSTYQGGTGRLAQDAVVGGTTTYTYDAAGNTEFTSNPGSPTQGGSASERAAFYGADGRLRATESRFVSDPGVFTPVTKYTFGEYRYDALGRRVWVWSKKTCDEQNLPWWEAVECQTSLLRRTVWDGDNELAEIQMPGGEAADEVALYENDVTPVQLPNLATNAGNIDRNQYFGRVLYTPGLAIDQPIAITRVNFAYQHNDWGGSIPYKVLGPITTMPFWNRNGDAPIGVFTNGARRLCTPPTTSPGDCVSVVWTYFWSAFDRNRGTVWDNWHGTVLERKRDKSGLGYSRNRYYDPATGRFTQEDPSGLAGGLNLYGFAAGDPVNFADPFGLRPLTATERRKFADLCRDIDCDEVEVYDGQGSRAENLEREAILAASRGRSFTFGHNIYLDDQAVAELAAGDFGALSHEMAHVVQYEKYGFAEYLRRGVNDRAAELTHGWRSVYGRTRVGGTFDFNFTGKQFWQYGPDGLEQPATIVQQCFQGSRAACWVSPYDPQ